VIGYKEKIHGSRTFYIGYKKKRLNESGGLLYRRVNVDISIEKHLISIGVAENLKFSTIRLQTV